MKDFGFEKLTRNFSYEVLKDGARVKMWGIPYEAKVEDLKKAISFLSHLIERIEAIRFEKENLEKSSKKIIDVMYEPHSFPGTDEG